MAFLCLSSLDSFFIYYISHVKSKSTQINLMLVSNYLFIDFSCVALIVGLGRRYFPHCSLVLDKFMEDDLPDLFYLQKGTPDEQKIKRMRFCELKDDVRKAFSKDKAENGRSGFSSSSSSSSSLKGDLKQQKATRK